MGRSRRRLQRVATSGGMGSERSWVPGTTGFDDGNQQNQARDDGEGKAGIRPAGVDLAATAGMMRADIARGIQEICPVGSGSRCR